MEDKQVSLKEYYKQRHGTDISSQYDGILVHLPKITAQYFLTLNCIVSSVPVFYLWKSTRAPSTVKS